VTYGAGGSTRDKTLGIVTRIQKDFGLTSMMHLTCVNSTREQLREVIEQARANGIANLLALRGDPPGGTGPWTAIDGGFTYSYELVEFIRSLG
ncbi:methylenetetrahydrofolate reductase, partial [Enterococcus casseliflavus]|uniref:methylenetetrahydrofolate reductase n=1 Tax=Enterococcus casseliflavus TaxID=37734 RepID=UPI003D11280A